MPPEQLPPWDRKGQSFRKPNHRYEYAFHYDHHHHNNGGGYGGGDGGGGGGGGGRWRDSPSYSPYANGFRYSSEFHRLPGHGKQGGWRSYREESPPHGYATPRFGDRFLDNECFEPSTPQGNVKIGRFYGNNCKSFNHRQRRGCSWENNQLKNRVADTPGRTPSMNDQRSVGNSRVSPSEPNSNPSAQFDSEDQTDKTGHVDGSGVSQRISKEDSLETPDWKPLKWSRSGSLRSRCSGFSRSSGSKLMGGESRDVNDELHVKTKSVTPIRSPSFPEETGSRKKPRLGWGEGLSKYEKKNVDGAVEGVTTIESKALVDNVEPTHPFTSNLVNKSSESTGFSGCLSPATPLSFACSSSPELAEKTSVRVTDGDSNNVNVSSILLSEDQAEGMQFSLKKLEQNSITDLSSLLTELLLQVDDQFSRDSGDTRSSAFNKLMLWKREISKSLELTESEIDSLENNLDSLKGDSGQGTLCPILSGSSRVDDNGAHSDYLNDCSRLLQKPAAESEDEDIVTPGSATSKFVEPLLLKRSVIDPENLVTCDYKKRTEESHSLGDDANVVEDRSSVVEVENHGVSDSKELNTVDIILASNKETALKASGMLSNLLPRVETGNIVDGMNEFRLSCLGPDAKIKKKLLRKRQLLKFKERIILLKYKALNFLWKEDLRLLSLSCRTRRQKKLDVTSQTMQKGNQKHTRVLIRCNFASPGRSSSLVPSAKALHSIEKLLSVCNVKSYRSILKMPAMILDAKDKASSMFVSTNGLVEDPWAVEKERSLFNPWTTTEKETFMAKLATLGKDFRKIASFLDHKTVADCIEFYYKNHKSESFVKAKKLNVKKRAKLLSSNTFMLTYEKNFGREPNSTSLDVLGAASSMVAQADRKLKADRLQQVADNEQDTVTASTSTRTMTSVDSKIERKPKKVVSIATELMIPKSVENEVDIFPEKRYVEKDPTDWTNDERLLFLRAFSSYGKDFVQISRFVRTKTRDQCKVFFSKARKCLDLETSYLERCSRGHIGSNDTNGSGSNVEDESVDTSVDCCVDSDSTMDEEVPHLSLDILMHDSTSVGTMADFPDLGHGEVVDDTQRGSLKGPPMGLSTNAVTTLSLGSKIKAPDFQKQFLRKCSHLVSKNAVTEAVLSNCSEDVPG